MAITLTIVRSPDGTELKRCQTHGSQLTIGRGSDNDWVLPDPNRLLSRRHCILEFRDGHWQIADASLTGTFLNNDAEPIGAGRPRILHDGDRLRLGHYEIKVHISAEMDGDDGAARSRRRDDVMPPFDDPFGDRTQHFHAIRPPNPCEQMPLHAGGTVPGDELLPADWDRDLLADLSGSTLPEGKPAPVTVIAPAPAAVVASPAEARPQAEPPPPALTPNHAQPATKAPVAHPQPQTDLVQFGVSHPASLPNRTAFLIRAIAFRHEDRAAVLDYVARTFGSDQRLPVGAESHVQHGARIAFHITMDGCTVDPPSQTITWCGHVATVSFRVTPAPGTGQGPLLGVCDVRVGRASLCQVHFEIQIAPGAPAHPALAEMKPIASAFISYARLDYLSVRACVRGMEAVGVKTFMDRQTLRAGQRWQDEIFRNIDLSEKLLLFWSRHARKSGWVEREWRYGLQRKGVDFIRPVPLEDPGRVPPPQELGVLHFDDPWSPHRRRTVVAAWTWLRLISTGR